MSKRHAQWFDRREYDVQFQINGDRVARTTTQPINIGEFMEIKTTYKQTKLRPIIDKVDYKTKHFHKFSIITTEYDCNEDFAVHVSKHFYNDGLRNKPNAPLPYRQRFIMFMKL
eukprot:6137906-Amphidinium_carterae.2